MPDNHHDHGGAATAVAEQPSAEDRNTAVDAIVKILQSARNEAGHDQTAREALNNASALAEADLANEDANLVSAANAILAAAVANDPSVQGQLFNLRAQSQGNPKASPAAATAALLAAGVIEGRAQGEQQETTRVEAARAETSARTADPIAQAASQDAPELANVTAAPHSRDALPQGPHTEAEQQRAASRGGTRLAV